MAKSKKAFLTLGEKLSSREAPRQSKTQIILSLSLVIGLLGAFATSNPFIGMGTALLCAAILSLLKRNLRGPEHFLVRFDRQGIISELKLSQKTVVFDGSNIYHFGLDHKIDALPLGALVSALRSEGYRIVCFFDANIYFTLRENGAFKRGNSRFSIRIIQKIFELEENEIYVVPKGVQADKFIVETLSHLPISFAVTNDRFRDYEDVYPFLTEDNQWRKGVKIQGRQLKLFQHKFRIPLMVK